MKSSWTRSKIKFCLVVPRNKQFFLSCLGSKAPPYHAGELAHILAGSRLYGLSPRGDDLNGDQFSFTLDWILQTIEQLTPS